MRSVDHCRTKERRDVPARGNYQPRERRTAAKSPRRVEARAREIRLPALSVPFAVMMTVSVLTTADAVEVMLSWIVPLDVVIVAGLKAIVVPSESPDPLSVSGAVEVAVRENVNVASTVTPCLGLISVGVTDRFTRNEIERAGAGPGVCRTAAPRGGENHAGEEQRPAASRSTSIRGCHRSVVTRWVVGGDRLRFNNGTAPSGAPPRPTTPELYVKILLSDGRG